MIELFEGRPGAGKTLFLVSRLLKIRRANPARAIYTNFQFGEFDEDGRLVVPYSTMIRTWDELSRVHNGTVGIDESHLWAPSEGSKTLPFAQRVLLKQHRKNGLDIYLTDQSYDHTAKVVRDMVAIVYSLQRFGPLMIASGRDPFSHRDYGKIYSVVSERVFLYYRTEEVIGDGNTGEGYGFGAADKYQTRRPTVRHGCKLPSGAVLQRFTNGNGDHQAVRYYHDDDPQRRELWRSGWRSEHRVPERAVEV